MHSCPTVDAVAGTRCVLPMTSIRVIATHGCIISNNIVDIVCFAMDGFTDDVVVKLMYAQTQIAMSCLQGSSCC